MAANVYNDKFVTRNAPAWHSEGKVFTGTLSAVEALDSMGDFAIDKLPLTVQVPGYGTWTPDNRFALVRRPTTEDPSPALFGEVGNSYAVVQNSDVASIMDKVIDGTSWKLETGGFLGQGETIFFSAQKENIQVNGDDYGYYMLVTDTRDGKGSLTFLATLVRVVCQNTLRMAVGRKSPRISLRHSPEVLLEASWRANVLNQVDLQQQSMVAALQTLSEINVAPNRMIEILETVFPNPTMPKKMDLKAASHVELRNVAERSEYQYEYRKQIVENSRQGVYQTYMEDIESGAKPTGYTALNSLTFWIDHQSGKLEKKDGSLSVSSIKSRNTKTAFSPEMDEMRTRFYAEVCK